MIAEHVERTAAPQLRGIADRVVGYRLAGHPAGVHAGLPSPTMTFIVSFDDPLTLSVQPDGSTVRSDHWAMVSGLHDRPASILHDGNQHGIQIDVSPLATRALFGLPAGALARQAVSLDDIVGPHGAELVDRLAASSSWSARFDVVDHVLTGRVAALERDRHGADPVRWQLVRAWTRLSDDGAPVADVAAELGWSRRHLRNRFRDEFGINPSTLTRISRFHRTQRWIRSHPAGSLAEVAARCGYADQSHMSRDFSEFAGASPRSWLRDEQFPSVHDVDTEHVAGSIT